MTKQHFLILLLSIFSLTGFALVKTHDIRVISFNIRNSFADDGVNNWENRKGLVLKTLKKRDADVMGMQEVTRKQYLYLKENLTGYDSHAIGRKDGKLEDEITAIFYKNTFELLEDSTVWLSEKPAQIGSKSWDSALPRTVSWVKLKDPQNGKAFMFLNTHFDHRGKKAREESARLIMKIISENHDGLPVILLGDFNTTVQDAPYRIITTGDGLYPPLHDARLISSAPHKGGDITFNGFRNDYGKVIDFIFVSDGVRVMGHRYLNIRKGDLFISDHYPVEADLKLPRKNHYFLMPHDWQTYTFNYPCNAGKIIPMEFPVKLFGEYRALPNAACHEKQLIFGIFGHI